MIATGPADDSGAGCGGHHAVVLQGPQILVISPHLDDAVLGCGALLDGHPGASVLTVFAGMPPEPARQTDWDRAAGFGDAGVAIAARRREDLRALLALQAQAEWLPFCDSQYGEPPSPDVIASALAEHIARLDVRTVLMPLGLFHCDHILVSEAALITASRDFENLGAAHCWLVYEDALYRSMEGVAAQRFAELSARGIALVDQPLTTGRLDRKRLAIEQYDSQLRALNSPGKLGFEDALKPERYWRLVHF